MQRLTNKWPSRPGDIAEPDRLMSLAAAAQTRLAATLFALSLGHGCADLCSGALFALLPFLVSERHYGYGAAACSRSRPAWPRAVCSRSSARTATAARPAGCCPPGWSWPRWASPPSA